MLSIPLRILSIAFALAVLSPCAAAAAKGNANQDLKIGLSYVVPTYQAGMKFRTPEGIDTALANELAKSAKHDLKIVRADHANRAQLLSLRKLDTYIGPISESENLRSKLIAIPTRYTAGPMAIMRTDTTIKNPSQLRGRKVCISEGGAYVGMLEKNYGAIEIVNKAPADSLLAIRIGSCDAAVHDSAMLEELIKLPEWKKFSASLYLGPKSEQAFYVRKEDVDTLSLLKQASEDWRKSDFVNKEIKQMVRHIAFEVYLDQNVPDCH